MKSPNFFWTHVLGTQLYIVRYIQLELFADLENFRFQRDVLEIAAKLSK